MGRFGGFTAPWMANGANARGRFMKNWPHPKKKRRGIISILRHAVRDSREEIDIPIADRDWEHR